MIHLKALSYSNSVLLNNKSIAISIFASNILYTTFLKNLIYYILLSTLGNNRLRHPSTLVCPAFFYLEPPK